VKSLVSMLILPPAGPLLLALLGGLLRWRWRRSWVAGSMIVLGLSVSVLFTLPVVAHGLVWLVEGTDSKALTEEALRAAVRGTDPATAIVILGGGVHWDGRERPHRLTANGRTLARLTHGAWVARLTGLPVLVSGGVAPGRVDPGRESEASVMARTLESSFGIRARWKEELSPDTAGNGMESAAMLRAAGTRRVILVTQAYHMRRARQTFEAAGLQVVPAPHGFAGGIAADVPRHWIPSASAVQWSWLATHEMVGLLWYRLQRTV
jgi:uncharacterized SAM-binding protein YcdF (DUF218 family)